MMKKNICVCLHVLHNTSKQNGKRRKFKDERLELQFCFGIEF